MLPKLYWTGLLFCFVLIVPVSCSSLNYKICCETFGYTVITTPSCTFISKNKY